MKHIYNMLKKQDAQGVFELLITLWGRFCNGIEAVYETGKIMALYN